MTARPSPIRYDPAGRETHRRSATWIYRRTIASGRTTSPRETPHDAFQEAPPPLQSGRPGPALSHADLWRALLRRAGAQVRVARARDAGRRRLPDLPRRAEPGRQPRAQPGVVRHDLDGARGGTAHRRVAEQELRRSGRVPAHDRDPG